MAGDSPLDQIREYFEDDSRTFRDGPITSYFRLRKWLLLATILLAAFHHQWLEYDRISKFFMFGALPQLTLFKAITWFSIYLLFQATLLLVQIRYVYLDDVRSRARLHGAKKIREAEDAVRALQETIDGQRVASSDDDDTRRDTDHEKALEIARKHAQKTIERYAGGQTGILWTDGLRDLIRILPIYIVFVITLLGFGAPFSTWFD